MFDNLTLQTGATNPILRMKADEVGPDEFTSGFVSGLVTKMAWFMDKHQGIGIAAPQVGVSKRVFLMHRFGTGSVDLGKVEVVCNPQILAFSKKMVMSKEGCLSLPGMEGIVERHDKIRVKYQNEAGSWKELDLKGLNSIVFQHESDHLNGVLFIDKLIKSTDYNKDDLVL